MYLIAATLLAAEACPPGARPAISTPPSSIAAGGMPIVTMTGAPPGAPVRVEAHRPDVYGRPILYRSTATFRADRCGRVSLADPPLEAAWTDGDPRGLLWSMSATAEAPGKGWNSGEVRLAADFGADGSVEATGRLEIATSTAMYREVALGADHPGAFFIHPAPGARRPVIILLGGSDGGDGAARFIAPRFLARGYAVLGVPYYQPGYGPGPKIPGLPAAFADIPLDRLEGVLAWIRKRDDAGRVGIYGVSKGAEYALAAASRIEGFDAVAAIVPSDVIWEGWGAGSDTARSSFSWRGAALPFVPYEGMREALGKLARGEPARLRDPHDRGRAANPVRVGPARIAVENIQAPVLVAGGGEDRTWASGTMATAIADTRRARNLPTVALVFPDAGHGLSGTGDIPAEPASARAQRLTFAATLRFFYDALVVRGEKGVRK